MAMLDQSTQLPSHAAISPDTAVKPDYDVAIVGLGPSGAVAAGLLGRAGLKTLVCDRLEGVYDKPRAIALDHEIMRVFQQMGVVQAVLPHVEPFTPSEFFGVQGQLIRRMTMVDPPYPQGYTPSMVFTQPPVERALRETITALPSVTVALGTELVALQQDSHRVRLDLRKADGSLHTASASYVIGCDGASSTVRNLLGLELEDLGFDEPWLVVDVLVNDQGLAKLPATSVQYCEPERPCTLVIGPNNHRRWEISLLPGEDPQAAATPERTWQLLSRWLGPQDGTLWRQASYRFHALVAKQWQLGRVFIAGDAAHQQPPFLGQGMCQGIRDAANLAWKLEAVLQGEANGEVRGGVQSAAAQALLASYGEERRAHVRELTTRIKGVGTVVSQRDRQKALERDARMLADCGGVVKDTPRQDILPALECGCLSAVVSTARGLLFPQPRVLDASGQAVLADEVTGYGWHLFMDGVLPLPPGLVPLLAVVQVGPAGLHELDAVVANWMQKHQCHAALVRPDHYTFGVALDSSALAQLLLEWQRWVPST